MTTQTTTNWLVRWQYEDEYGVLWPSQISWEEHLAGKIGPFNHREGWCYGAPGVARALWLAGAAMGEEAWQETALRSLQGSAKRPEADWGVEAPTLCHGVGSGCCAKTHLRGTACS